MINQKYIRVLFIDLSKQKAWIKNREDLYGWLGGAGVASKLLEENLFPDLDAFHEQQPIIFAIGPMTSVFPVVTKTVAMFKSPLTNELGESYAGGRLALSMFNSGYDAIVISGKAEHPIYLSICDHNVEFKDARTIWHMNPNEAGRVIRDIEPGQGKRSIIRIGPAGENLVRYASVNVDTYRHFGRLGLGAVFGSKNLKALSIIGSRDIHIKNFKEYFNIYRKIYDRVTDTDIMSKYHDIGTPINVAVLNGIGSLPTRNLSESTFEHGDAISGEAFASEHLVRKMACTGCPVGCIHIGQYRREFDKGHEYETINASYDHELIFALGSFLGTKTAAEVLELIDQAETCGLDVMSAGVTLGWAAEAYSQGLITNEQTLVPLSFGDTRSFLKAIEYIGLRKNEFYRVLGEGVDYASSIYGGRDYAMALGKNEMTGYHTGYGAIIGQAVGARHSHLCNAGYSFDQSMKEFDAQKLTAKIFEEEKERCMLNSLCICLFARKVYDRETVLAALKALGVECSDENLTRIGRDIFKLKMKIKGSMGFKFEELTFPQRFFETPALSRKLDAETAYKLRDMYAKIVEDQMNED
jgi:aldehyde:ferredoxin oxidoreductase